MLIWFPKVNVGPSLFIRRTAVDSPKLFALGSTDADWKAGGY